MGHTPGNWEVISEEYGGNESRITIGVKAEDDSDGPDFVPIAEVIESEETDLWGELWANVNLIKAAPELLAASVKVQKAFSYGAREWPSEAMTALFAAIAKATGEVQHG